MDFGIMSTFNNNNNNTSKILSHNEKQQHGSLVSNKQLRSDYNTKHKLDIDQQQQQHLFPTSKSLKSDYFDQPNKTMSLRSDSLLSVSAPNFDDADNNNNIMLSFSSSSSNSNSNTTKDGASHFSFYQPPPNSYIKNTGLQTGMHMPAVSRYKGPFTPSQWMELEHQALIYKYFVANVPVPSHLLTSLRKSLNTFFFPGSSSSISYAPNSYGWGTFHLGFSGNGDPEPGRCRRTDGKKWRCSRDAVPDQKYCERHINRGRHRSRKPVEGQNGHAVSGPAASKAGQVVSSSSVPISASRVSTTALAGATVNNQCTTLQHHNAVLSSSIVTPINRGQESQAFGINLFSIPKQHNTTEESSESLMNPTNFNSFLDQGAPNPNTNPLSNFIDEWSKEQSLKSDWTQLSMSIPMASDFSSSSNSPAQEKLTTPPLALTTEFDLDPTHKQGLNWIPISWGNSMGGPLGEALNQTSGNSGMQSKNTSSGSEMNQMNEMWDTVNYHVGSSPTGVLQKTTFVSLSNSSSGSSPKGDKKDEYCGSGGSICNELLVSTFAN